MKMKLNRIKLIGKGTFSSVYLEQDEFSKILYATKIINEKKIGLEAKKFLENEINTLNMTNHQNIIKLYRILKSENYIFLIMEYCNGGSLYKYLYEYINKYKQAFPEKVVQRIMKKVLEGVNFLHQKGIIHRSLKLGNILLKYESESNKNIDSAEIKIIHFKNNYISKNSKPSLGMGITPTITTSFVKKLLEPYYYNEIIDIWSLGIICYEMLFGRPLFPNMNEDEIIKNILSCNFQIPKTISVQARTFLLNMLQKDGINKLSSSQLLNHDFIKGDYHNFTKYTNEIDINNNNLDKEKSNLHKSFNLQTNNLKLKDSTFKNDSNKICNKCGKNIINNLVYKCEECSDFNYCERCYLLDNNDHNHKFKNINGNIIKPTKTFDNKIWNIIFKLENGSKINVPINFDNTIKDLLKLFFTKINRLDLVNNWEEKYYFTYNLNNLSHFKEAKIKDKFNNGEMVEVYRVRNLKKSYY